MKEKKYELTDETIDVDGQILHRIKAVKDFGDVKKGDFGGFIEKRGNLDQTGNCWVYDNAKILDNAKVYGDARVRDDAMAWGNSCIYDNADICDNAHVADNAKVCGGTVRGRALLLRNASISSDNDYITFEPTRLITPTVFKCIDSTVMVVCDGFVGTLDEFDAYIENHYNNDYIEQYIEIIKTARKHFKL